MHWKISVKLDEYIFLVWPVETVPDLHPPLSVSSLYGFGSCLNNHCGTRIPFADSLTPNCSWGAAHAPNGTSQGSAALGVRATRPSGTCVLGGSPRLPAARPFCKRVSLFADS